MTIKIIIELNQNNDKIREKLSYKGNVRVDTDLGDDTYTLSDAVIAGTAWQLARIAEADSETTISAIMKTGAFPVDSYKSTKNALKLFEDDVDNFRSLPDMDKDTSFWPLLIDAYLLADEEELLRHQIGLYIELFHEAGREFEELQHKPLYKSKLKPFIHDKQKQIEALLEEGIRIKKYKAEHHAEIIHEKELELKKEKQATIRGLIKIALVYMAVMACVLVGAMLIHGPVDMHNSASYFSSNDEWKPNWDHELRTNNGHVELKMQISFMYPTTYIEGEINNKYELSNAFRKSTVYYEDGTRGWIQLRGKAEAYTLSSSPGTYYYYEHAVVKYGDELYYFCDIEGE